MESNIPQVTVAGIDFGCYSSVISIYQNGTYQIVPSAEGNLVFPSFYCYNERISYIGEVAKYNAIQNRKCTVYDMKELIGKKEDDISKEEIANYPVPISFNESGELYFSLVGDNLQTKEIRIEDIVSQFLKEMVKTASRQLMKDIRDVVISCPSCFSDSQQKALLSSAKSAHLNVLKLVPESIAAVTACDLPQEEEPRHCLVFDLGYKSLNISVIRIEGKTNKSEHTMMLLIIS